MRRRCWPSAFSIPGWPEPHIATLNAGNALSLKADFHLMAVFVRDSEHGARLQSHDAGDEDVGNLAYPRVVSIDVIIEEFASVGDTLLEFRDAVLQAQKILIRFELRIIFRYGEQASQCGDDVQIGAGFLANAGGVHGRCASLSDGQQCLLLMLHVSLDSFDEVGDLVMTLLEQDIDVGPGAVILVPQAHQAVVQDHAEMTMPAAKRKKA